MTEAALRGRIRDLMASGVLPGEPAPIQRPVPPPPQAPRNRRLPCTICGEGAPQVPYFYSAGLVVRVHTVCDAVWKQERTPTA